MFGGTMTTLDRLAPLVAGLLVAVMVLAAVAYGAHQLSSALESLPLG